MTLLNVFVDANRALVAVDTRTKVQFPGEEQYESSKLLLIPHAGMVIAGRGYVPFTVLAHNALTTARGDMHFDWVMDNIRDVWTVAESHVMQAFPPPT